MKRTYWKRIHQAGNLIALSVRRRYVLSGVVLTGSMAMLMSGAIAQPLSQSVAQAPSANPLPATSSGEDTTPAADTAVGAPSAVDAPLQLNPIPGLNGPLPEDFVEYRSEAMAFSHPSSWSAERTDAGTVALASTSADGTVQAATEIFRVEAPPGPLVDANIDSFIAEGAAVNLYRTVTIDGRSALIMWLSDRPDELSGAIATFIGYDTETIFLFTRYRPEDSETEADILATHRSFTRQSEEVGDEE